MREIYFEHFNVHPDAEEFTAAAKPLAECYRQVFGNDETWQEGKWCKKCSTPHAFKKWRLADAPNSCTDCGGELTDFWPVSQIIDDMRHEFRLPRAVCVVAKTDDGKVIGCCWGYTATADELVSHLNHGVAPEAQAAGVKEALAAAFPGEIHFAYQDEIFVLPEYQRMGIGKNISKLRFRALSKAGARVFVLRTKTNPPSKTYLWFHDAWGYVVVGRYPDADGRVVLAQSIDRLPIKL